LLDAQYKTLIESFFISYSWSLDFLSLQLKIIFQPIFPQISLPDKIEYFKSFAEREKWKLAKLREKVRKA
jgi:hypothetical protein